MNIYLFRHGMTAYNADHRYQGRLDIPLCPAGEAALCKAPFEADKVYISPLIRVRRTAEILFPDSQLIPVEGLREMDFGDFEGRNYIQMEHDRDYRAWVDSGCTGRCPNGESRSGFTARVVSAFQGLLIEAFSEKAEQLVIVAHGGVQMALGSSFAQPVRTYHDWQTGCGEGLRFTCNQALWESEKRLMFAEHLRCTH